MLTIWEFLELDSSSFIEECGAGCGRSGPGFLELDSSSFIEERSTFRFLIRVVSFLSLIAQASLRNVEIFVNVKLLLVS